MKILAIESSCDDTAVAIVEDGRQVLASVRETQNELHARFGGVVPEIAARQHMESIHDLLQNALDQANCQLSDIDAFAATLGPGLIGSLLIGATTAKTLSLITQKPFLGVNHLYAHVASNYLETNLKPPFLCLLVSGGHTQLIHVQDYARMSILGETQDDAAGEAYDKVARLMALPYPGGPALDQLAKLGNPKAFVLPQAVMSRPYDFSFSGLKTATARTYEKALKAFEKGVEEAEQQQLKADMSASFQHAVVEVLFKKTWRCAKDHGLTTIALAGGVSANEGLRKLFESGLQDHPDYQFYCPKMSFCTDNAAMVGASAYFNPITTDIEYEVFSRAV